MIIKRENNVEFLKDFLNVPKVKNKISIKELKKAYEEQYIEEVNDFIT